MTRFVPLTTTDGTKLAINAHSVTDIVEMPDGLVRLWCGDEFQYEIPGTVAQIAALLSDPPAGVVRFVDFPSICVNAAAVVSIEDESAEYTALTLHGRETAVYVRGSRRDVIAKLEGRAL